MDWPFLPDKWLCCIICWMLEISIRTLSGLEELQDIKRPMWKSMEEVRMQRAAEHIRKQCCCRFRPPFGRGCGHCAMY